MSRREVVKAVGAANTELTTPNNQTKESNAMKESNVIKNSRM